MSEQSDKARCRELFEYVVEKLMNSVSDEALLTAQKRVVSGEVSLSLDTVQRRYDLTKKIMRAHADLVLKHMDESDPEDTILCLSMAFSVIGGSYGILNGKPLDQLFDLDEPRKLNG